MKADRLRMTTWTCGDFEANANIDFSEVTVDEWQAGNKMYKIWLGRSANLLFGFLNFVWSHGTRLL